MGIFEFIQHLRKDFELKKLTSDLFYDLRNHYLKYKNEDASAEKMMLGLSLKWSRILKDDYFICFQRAYARFESWKDVEDLKDRTSLIEIQLKEMQKKHG